MAIRLRGLLRSRTACNPHGLFLVDARRDRVIDNAGMAEAARAWSRELDALHVPPGARVLVDVDDPLAFAVVHLSVIAAGRCSAPVNPESTPAEELRARHVLRPVLVVTDRAARPGLRIHAGTGLPIDPIARPDAPVPDAGPPGSAALLTSGSTGAPKTVVLGEAQLLHVAAAVARHNQLTPADRGFNPLPLFHINAQVVGLLATLVSGASLVLDRRFRRTGFWPVLAAHDVTWLNAVPAVLTILSREEIPVLPPRLRFVRSASAPLAGRVRGLIAERTGVPVVESYGMTEAASQITATPLHAPVRPGSVGRPVDVELEVVDRDGVPCAPGVVGRVRIRGAGVIRGYAGGAGDERIDTAHWLDTADLGRLDDDGYLYLVGRADDVVNRGGELVYPREIEETLLDEPGVVDAVVIGRPDEVLGAVPVALVRTADELDAVAGAEFVGRLVARCATHLARYKRPAEIRLVGAFPLAPTGKVRRTELRRQLADELAATGR
ncbi:AMP-binding protein [Pseudonocardia xinjiangensis]|uniref:AMP-binding protein n=1 Tax=Pseudonocardia xinjiangensis TaxID=75289 RepID=A0ABX1RI67_9PSEU|nr:AMP-binding protein [Pseudonocardia xinjiangensis]NMH79687.1 AMP-binding protein [Pseudonocardia xinjiangensis]